MATKIERAWEIVRDICNDPNVGYSQTYRQGKTVNGITYYDCSSLISYALYKSGILKSNPWFTTRNERVILIENGFTEYDADIAWRNGDILWRSGHTEMVYNAANYITMGAHTSNTSLKNQVSINTFSGKGKWDFLYRYEKEGEQEMQLRVGGHKVNTILAGHEFTDSDAAYIKTVLESIGFDVVFYEETDEKKPIEDIAREVLAGLWGNGDTRKARLEAAGYDYAEIQRKVNELLNA
nr:MAG TPA: peptidoglycan hydrolase [Caudoviricetes sp.]